MIAIVDYGMGNLRSVQKAVEAVGYQAVITRDPAAVRRADRLILPGVGAFSDAMSELDRTGLGQATIDFCRTGKPFLGICLGLQLCFEESTEDGPNRGLGLLPGRVVRFADQPGLKIPHMGWNSLDFQRPHAILQGIEPGNSVYFVHSYFAVPEDPEVIIATSDYPGPFPAIVARENLVACQFHPEKSQAVGLRMYANFGRI